MSGRTPQAITIDVGAILHDTVATARPDLVTRPTGRAVREAIEARIARARQSPSVSVLDFTAVRILDFSCADEVVAKLLARYVRGDRPSDVFFLVRALGEVHRHAVEQVLGRHGLAAVCDLGQGYELLGPTSEEEQLAWQTLETRKRIDVGDFAREFGERSGPLVSGLAARRLAWCGRGGGASALSALAPATGTPTAKKEER